MRFRFRKGWTGSEHGIARGVAVYGTPDFDSRESLGTSMNFEGLRRRSLQHGLMLNSSPESLAALDGRLDAWNADPSSQDVASFAIEVGAYLGT
jgi:hypothetical protein